MNTKSDQLNTGADWSNVWIYVYASVLILLFSVLIGRIYYLQVAESASHKKQRTEQTRVVKTKEAPRGNIFDEQGRLLVTSQLRMSVFADPGLVDQPEKTADRLSSILDVERSDLLEKLQREHDRFIWVKRKVTPSVAERIRQEDLKGVRFRREYDRRYPHKSVASHVLGVVGTERKGLSGIELQYNRELMGDPVRLQYLRDGTGELMYRSSGHDQVRPKPGSPLKLTMNLAMQEIVEEELNQLTEKYQPNWASVIAMNPNTGTVKALANRPTFDPSSFEGVDKNALRNRAITDPVEPGSVIKPFVMAAGIQEGVVTPDTRIFCGNGEWTYNGRVLNDYKSFGELTASEVIERSSNIGMAKIGVDLGSKLRPWIKRFRFGEKTGIRLPGEDPGKVQSKRNWNTTYTQTSVPMGHEILATPLQVTSAFCVFANGGTLIRPKLLKELGEKRPNDIKNKRTQVLRRSTVNKLKKMLRGVVTDGTGAPAQSDIVRIAGKTGTSKKYSDKDRYLSVFVAFAPVDDPQLVIGAFVDEAEGAHGGGNVVAPMVRRIFERASQFGSMHVSKRATARNSR